MLRQHGIQSKIQDENPFVCDYMAMLGHHEFGFGRLDFDFGNHEFEFDDKDDINYWLERWVDYYQNALLLQSDSLLFVGNELIATKPNLVVDAILGRVGLSSENEHPAREIGNSNPCDYTTRTLSPAMVELASQTYAELKVRAATS